MTNIQEGFSRLTAFIDRSVERLNPFGAKELRGRNVKLALPNVILQGIWHASAFVKSLPLAKDTVSRPTDDSTRVLSTSMNFELKLNSTFDKNTFQDTKKRFSEYAIYPPFPTEPTPINEQQTKKLLDSKFLEDLKLPKLISKPGKENLLEAQRRTPFKDISPEARLVYNHINLVLVKEHLQDITTLANHVKDTPDLGRLGADYFEIETYDTLSRGLAFIDKDLLKNLAIEVPIRQANGQFKLESYQVERFNLSGSETVETGNETKIDHDKGHPIFLLKPTDNKASAPPIVVARGTLLADDGHDGAIASVQADGRKDLSMKWIMGNGELKAKMDNLYEQHGPVRVAGHSLGGNIALCLGVAYSEHIDRAVTISAPQLSNKVYEAWENIPEAKRPKIDNIFVEGDLVPGGGNKIPGFVISAEARDLAGQPDHSSNATKRHLLPFNNGRVLYAAVDKTRETHKLARRMATINVIMAGRSLQNIRDKAWRLFAGQPPVSATMPKVSDTPNRQSTLARLNDSVLRSPPKWEGEPAWEALAGGDEASWSKLERMSPHQIEEKYMGKMPEMWNKFKERFDNNQVSPALMHKMYAIMPQDEKKAFSDSTSVNHKKFNAFAKLYDTQLDDDTSPIHKINITLSNRSSTTLSKTKSDQ